jgi:hypothetical protein
MAEEWKRAELLLEKISSDVKAIAEGHSLLNRKIDEKFDSLSGEMNERFDDLSSGVKDISRDLKGHIRQTVPPAHVPV